MVGWYPSRIRNERRHAPAAQVSHTKELHAAGYSFYVLPDVFVIHAEHGVPPWRGKGDLVRLFARTLQWSDGPLYLGRCG